MVLTVWRWKVDASLKLPDAEASGQAGFAPGAVASVQLVSCGYSSVVRDNTSVWSHVAAQVLAGGGKHAAKPFTWRAAGYGRREDGGKAYVHASMWGSTIHPKKGGTWLGAGWRWRTGGGEDSDFEEEGDDPYLEEKARAARRALREGEALASYWEPENGTCVRCVERHVRQAPTFLAR